jgi:peptide/nickel transport system ATP-binding protein
MQEANDCLNKVKKDCFKFISSQETKKDKFKNKERMIKSFLIPVSQWISKKTNNKKTLIIGLAGGQGSGKTTMAKAILQLIKPSHGSVYYRGDNLCDVSGRQLRRHRGDLQMVFQDPYSSMNPRMLVGAIIKEGMIAQNIGINESERDDRVRRLLLQVGLDPSYALRYPHEFSGGQRQRICIARALAVEPKVLICDEPTSALDVSVQSQILHLLRGLQEELGLTYLFVTHNIGVVAYLAHQVAVMHQGKIVEYGSVDDVLHRPQHVYTRTLLNAVPKIGMSL